MGVSTTSNRIGYTGNGSSYSFPYYFFNQTDLKVYLYNSSAGTATLQTLNTHYTIGGTPNVNGIYSSGGSIITTCSIINTLQVVIYRDPSPVQNFSLLQSGLLPSTALVQQLDYITLLEQRLADQAARSVMMSDGINQTFDPTLPVSLTASSTIIVNGAGTGFAMGPQADQIASAQSSAIAAAASASSAQSSNVSAGNNAVLAASAAVSAGNSVGLIGSTAFWATQAQSSAISAGNQAVLAGSAAVSAGAQAALATAGVVLANSAAVSASNSAALAGSAAVSAGNQSVLAASAAVSAGNLIGSITFPISTINGGTGLTGAFPQSVALWNGSSNMSSTGAFTPGQILMTNPSGVPTPGSPLFLENILVNSAFDVWQVAVGSAVVVANSSNIYVPDQWYVSNFLGTNGAITVTRVGGQLGGSIYGCQVQITVAPTANQTNCTELWQVIDNPTTMARILGQSSAFMAAQIKALGAVNQIGMQLFTAASEVKPVNFNSSIVSETLVTVNSAGFTGCFGAIGLPGTYGAGSSGVVAMRIRVTGVLAGSTHVGSTGFVVEQAGLYAGTGSIQPAWRRKKLTPDGEFQECLRYFEKTYDPQTIPGTLTAVGDHHFSQPIAAGFVPGVFKVTKRATPTIVFLSPNTGVAGKCRDNTGSVDQTASAANQGMNQFTITVVASTGAQIGAHYTSDARI